MNEPVSVTELQQALNQLSFVYPALPRLSPTGIFDEDTLEAVMIFQRDFFPPVTGVVNEETWYAIFERYRSARAHFGSPALLRVFPSGTHVVNYEESDHTILIAEAIFNSLSSIVENFSCTPSTGTNIDQTHENLRTLQFLAGITPNGQLNRISWEYLTRLYHAFIVRRRPFSRN